MHFHRTLPVRPHSFSLSSLCFWLFWLHFMFFPAFALSFPRLSVCPALSLSRTHSLSLSLFSPVSYATLLLSPSISRSSSPSLFHHPASFSSRIPSCIPPTLAPSLSLSLGILSSSPPSSLSQSPLCDRRLPAGDLRNLHQLTSLRCELVWMTLACELMRLHRVEGLLCCEHSARALQVLALALRVLALLALRVPIACPASTRTCT